MDNTKLREIFTSGKAALLVIDMQGDYCSAGYYMDKAGYDIDRLRRPIPNISEVLNAVRKVDMPVIYTRQYREKALEVAQETENSFPNTSLRGEPGWEIIDELKPADSDIILDKTSCSVFVSTHIDELLREKGITTLLFCGNTFDICVHSSLRTAVDLNYNCITIADCCGAVNDNLFNWSVESIEVENGAFGKVIYSTDLLAALRSSE